MALSGQTVGSGGDEFGNADEIVGDEQAPHLLADARRRFAAQCFEPLERVGFHFIEGKLQLPAVVVEGRDLRGRVLGRVKQRGQNDVRPKAAAAHVDGTGAQRRGEGGMRAAVWFIRPDSGHVLLDMRSRHQPSTVISTEDAYGLILGL